MKSKLPEGWVEASLEDVTEYIARGIAPKYTEENGIKVVNQRCIRDYNIDASLFRLHNLNERKITEEKYLKDYDILVNSTGVGTLGRLAQIGKVLEPMTVDSHVTIVRGNEGIDKKFLNYSLVNKKRNIEHLAQGSTGQTELSRKRLGTEIKVNVPVVQEQKAIADTLSSLDDKIELNNKINENLEEQAQAIFKHWFVDFEFPDENGNPYKSSGGEMMKSELGMIPKGWASKTMNDLCEITSSKRIFRKEYSETGVPFFRGKEIIEKSKGNAVSTELFITEEKYNEIEEKFSVPIEKDILLTSVGTLGVSYQVRKEKFYFKDGNITWFKSFKNPELRNYVYIFLNSAPGKQEFDKITIGSTQKALTITALKTIPVILPDSCTLNKFDAVTGHVLDQTYNNSLQNKILSQLRDTLLPKLMSGELRIPLD